jgi:ribosomal protein S18 acetylase RimI-like enzyme
MSDYLTLTRHLTRSATAPGWPEGVALAPFSASIAPKVHTLMTLAYADGGGSVPFDFDTWWAATRHDPEFDASLCFVAMADGEPVGLALCWTSSFVKDLVVHPDWRHRGIGGALLRTAMLALADRGNSEVKLKVQSDNMEARRLYSQLGFRKG